MPGNVLYSSYNLILQLHSSLYKVIAKQRHTQVIICVRIVDQDQSPMEEESGSTVISWPGWVYSVEVWVFLHNVKVQKYGDPMNPQEGNEITVSKMKKKLRRQTFYFQFYHLQFNDCTMRTNINHEIFFEEFQEMSKDQKRFPPSYVFPLKQFS